MLRDCDYDGPLAETNRAVGGTDKLRQANSAGSFAKKDQQSARPWVLAPRVAVGSAKQREIDRHLRSERLALDYVPMESLGVLVSEGATGGQNGVTDLFAVEVRLLIRNTGRCCD
jgi:hypothetical protein